MTHGPLAGVRILDFSRLVPGAYCTLLLADLGAEVIKIEEPGIGDPLRFYPPYWRTQSAYFFVLNRNKRSLAVDLKRPAGREIILRLARTADVVVEGFRPGVMARLGLDGATLRQHNPRLVYCSLPGFGADGPWAGVAGHDLDYLAVAGALSLSQGADGAPAIPGVQVADLGGALAAASGILAGVIQALRTGQGLDVSASLYDSALAWLSIHAGTYFATGVDPDPSTAPLSGGLAYYGVYRTSDHRYMALGALEPQFWQAFCRAVERPDLADRQMDPDQPALRAELAAMFASRPQAEWAGLCARHDTCCMPVQTVSEAMAHPQTVASGMVQEAEHPSEGMIRYLMAPLLLNGRRPTTITPPPALGEATQTVLRDLGYDAAEVAALAASGIVAGVES